MPRLLTKYAADVMLWWLLTPLAFVLRLEGQVVDFIPEIALLMLVGLPVKAGIVYWLGWHRRSWRRVGVRDLYSLILGIFLVTAAFSLAGAMVGEAYLIPRSIPFIEGMLAALGLGGLRMATRLGSERYRAAASDRARKMRRVVIAGAGEAGVMVAREMLRHPEAGHAPIGFLDDDPSKRRERFLGLRVLGPVDALPGLVKRHAIDAVLIAMPSESGELVRRVVEVAREAGVEHRILPALHDLVSGNVAISDIREVDVQDLLRRDAVELDTEGIAHYLEGRTVLITGAGGSIGSEIARQVAAYRPRLLVLLGRGENSIYEVDNELGRTVPHVERVAVIADVRDWESLQNVFDRHRPDVVFHAAAHKHVPLMECHPEQAVFNNVIGTRNAVELSLQVGVSCFVNLSSDKAVNPTSIMGATKRATEMLVHHASHRCGAGATYVSVRFGNVLGSRGSVIPLFKEQIRRGGPVMVTHPDMKR
jgi:FlaA1/EpsC-like NDP-sugar epimerase